MFLLNITIFKIINICLSTIVSQPVIDVLNFFIFIKADPEIFKRGRGWGALCQPSWLTNKKNLGFRWSKKAQITLETISFWQNVYISIFKFSPFLSIKSYQFFKIYYRVDKEREKTLTQESMRKEEPRNNGLCFITASFIKPFQMIINHFFLFLKIIRSAIFAGETRNGK